MPALSTGSPWPSTLDPRRLRPDDLPPAVMALVQVRVPVASTGSARPADRERDLRGIADDSDVPVRPDDDLTGVPERVVDVTGTDCLEIPLLREHPAGGSDELEVVGVEAGRPIHVGFDEPVTLDQIQVGHSATLFLLGVRSA